MTPEDCRERRTRFGLSPGDLARRAGLVERTIVQFEAGRVQPREVTLVALRKAFRRLAAEQTDERGVGR